MSAELTRSRLRRKAASLDALRAQVEAAHLVVSPRHPRWIRINLLRTSLEDQLSSTFSDFTRVHAIADVAAAATTTTGKVLYIDEHVPNLVAISPNFEILKTSAYKSGEIILQDKASCFPAYLLDPHADDGDIIDSCAAPGNKTTHLAAIVSSQAQKADGRPARVFAFERNPHRAKTLETMVNLAGGDEVIHISGRQDFLRVDPDDRLYKDVGYLLLDPSCSGSGIVDREGLPPIHLPSIGGPDAQAQKAGKDQSRKRKRTTEEPAEGGEQVLVDDDGRETIVSSEKELAARLDTLSSFQLMLLQHAFKFPSAKRITYSTCSIHAQENEKVVLKALRSDVGKARGWRILTRSCQVSGLKDWPVRGSVDAADGDETIADACIRTYRDDGRGVMGFFVAGFVRDDRGVDLDDVDDDDNGPCIRHEDGRNARNATGMALPKGIRSLDEKPLHSDSIGGNAYTTEQVYTDDEWDGFTD